MSGRGWVKGEAYAIDYRGAEGSVERLAAVTAELVRLPADVIVAPGAAEALAAKNATKTLPIVIAGVDDPVEVEQYTDVEPAFATIKRHGSRVLVVPTSSMFVPHWIADLALANKLAVASMAPAYAYEGGLIACSDDWNALFERVATFVDRILKGAAPQALPVEVPIKFKVIVNTKTARALKLDIPPALRAHADTFIE